MRRLSAEEIDATNAILESKTHEERLAYAVDVFGDALLFTSSFGAGSGVLLHLWSVVTPERPVVLVAHGGLIAALTAALLGLPVDNWPALGGMGNASWVQLSGYSQPDAAPEDIRWRLDVWNASAQVANDVL